MYCHNGSLVLDYIVERYGRWASSVLFVNRLSGEEWKDQGIMNCGVWTLSCLHQERIIRQCYGHVQHTDCIQQHMPRAAVLGLWSGGGGGYCSRNNKSTVIVLNNTHTHTQNHTYTNTLTHIRCVFSFNRLWFLLFNDRGLLDTGSSFTVVSGKRIPKSQPKSSIKMEHL